VSLGVSNTEKPVLQLNLKWRHLWLAALLSSFAISIFMFVISSARFMAISNSWRTPDSQSLATDSRYHNYQVLEYLKQHPASTLLSFSPAWIRPHTNVRIVNYMDPEILHLFDSNNILSAEGLRIELQRLGISHIHKDNYFSFPMIYRTSFQQLLSDSRFVKPIVMGPGGNLFQLRSKSDMDIPAPRCITYSDPYLLTATSNSVMNKIIGLVYSARVIGSYSKPRFSSTFSRSGFDLQTRYLPYEFGRWSNDSAASIPSATHFLKIDAEIRGFGLAKGEIQFTETAAREYDYPTPSQWITFSESLDERGNFRLSGLVPIKENHVFRVRISTKPQRLPSWYEFVSLTVCLQN